MELRAARKGGLRSHLRRMAGGGHWAGSGPVGELWKRVGRKKVKIQPKQRRTLPVSVRFPPDLHAEVSAYADRLGADRTHVIVECVRQVLDGDREWKREWRKRAES